MYKAKQKFKRILSAFATVALLVCVLSTYTIGGAFATTEDGLEYVKSIEHKDGDNYKLSLTVSDVAGKLSNKVDVVLVVDTSGSMNYNMDGGGEEDRSDSVAVEDRRINIARNAVAGDSGFIDIMAENPNLDVNLSIVTFDNDVELAQGWTQITNNQGNVDTLKATVLNDDPDAPIQAGGATLTQGGLRKGNEILQSGRDDAKKIMVLVSDGEPSLFYSKSDDALATVRIIPPKRFEGNTYYIINSTAYFDMLKKYGYYDNLYYVGPNVTATNGLAIMSYTDYGKENSIFGHGKRSDYTLDPTRAEAVLKELNSTFQAPVFKTTAASAQAPPEFEEYLKNLNDDDNWYYFIPRENGKFVGGADTEREVALNISGERAIREASGIGCVDGFYTLSVSGNADQNKVLQDITNAAPLNDSGISGVVSVSDKEAFVKYFKDLATNIDKQVCSGISISDKLSDYVDLADDPNYAVKITDDQGHTTTIEDTNTGYPFKSVSYDPSSRTVTAVFKDYYRLEKGYKYELQFDVVIKPEAYKAFFDNVQDESNEGDGYAGAKGNSGSGSGSEDQPGFYSNADKGADVTVTYGSDPYNTPVPESFEYTETPVAQIADPKTITVTKEWKNTPEALQKEVKVTLTGTCKVSGEEREDLKITKELTLNKSNNWTATVKGLPSKYYTYTVAESETPVGLFLKPTIDDADLNSEKPSWTAKVTNERADFIIYPGRTETIGDKEKIDIQKLAFEKGVDIMTPELKELIENNPELTGTITYQWVDEKGKPVGNSTTSTITSSPGKLPEIPSYEFTGEWKGTDTEHVFTLKVTFEDPTGTDKIEKSGVVQVNVKHTIVPTGVKDKIVPGLLTISFMAVVTLLARMFVKRKERSVR